MDISTVLTTIGITGATAGALITIIKCHSIIKAKIIKKLEHTRQWFNDPIKTQLDELKKEFKDKDYRDCQTDILNYLIDVQNGEKKTEVQKEHIYHLHTHYTKNLDGNTYVEKEWCKVFNDIK